MKPGAHIPVLLLFLIAMLWPLRPAGGEERQLSSSGAQCRSPRLAVAPNGDAMAVWRELREGRVRIVTRQRLDNRWLTRQTLADVDTAEGDLREPLVRMDAGARPHVCWIEKRAGLERLVYRRIEQNMWQRPSPLSDSSSYTLSHANLAFDAQGLLHALWLENRGYQARLQSAALDGDRTLQRSPHGSAWRRVAYPLLLTLPSPRQIGSPILAALFYDIEGGGEPRLEQSVWNPTERKWIAAPVLRWPQGALRGLPIIAGNAHTPPFLVGTLTDHNGHERISAQFPRRPPLLLSRDGEGRAAYPLVSDSSHDRRFALVWRRERSGFSWLVRAAYDTDTQRIFRSSLPYHDNFLDLDPRDSIDVALIKNQLVCLRVATLPDPGADRQAILFEEIELPDPGQWETIEEEPET